MDLSAADIRDLAGFFAKRFPAASERERLCRSAGLDPALGSDAPDARSAWTQVVGFAVEQGRLQRLVRAARAQAPGGDENLDELVAILAPRPDRSTLVFAGSAVLAAAFVGMVGVGLLASYLADSDDAEALAAAAEDSGQPRPLLVATASGAASGGSALAAPSPPPALKTGSPPVAQAAAAVDDAMNAPEAAPEAPSSPRKAKVREARAAEVRPANVSGRCTSEPGEVVGYWYAGTDAPGSAGQSITMDRSVNVRADYPDKHNDYDARSAIRCVLKVGDELHLSKEPVEVPGGAYWVPLVTGDLKG